MTVNISWVDVTYLAPGLSAVSVASQDAILVHVDTLLDSAVWGEKYDLACTFLAAHFGALTLRQAGAGAGAVSSQSVGPVSVSFGSPAFSSSAYGSTVFGAQFEALSRTLVKRVGFVT